MAQGEKLLFARDVGPLDWSALPREFKAGDLVFRFRGHTYGLDRDDFMYLNRETIAICQFDGDKHHFDAFFTCPVEFLVDEEGVRPVGEYMRIS